MRFFNLFLISLLTAISYARVCLQHKVLCPTRRVCHGSGPYRFCYNIPSCRIECVQWGPVPLPPRQPSESGAVGTENAARVCIKRTLRKTTKRVCSGSGKFRFCFNIPQFRYVCLQWKTVTPPTPPKNTDGKNAVGTSLMALECKKVCTKRICIKLPPTTRQICVGGKCAEWCPPKKTCTADVKKCDNGSFVARDPSNGCEFKPCPVCTKRRFKCEQKKICMGSKVCINVPINCKLTCEEYKSGGEAQAYTGQIAGIENAETGCRNVCVPRKCTTIWNVEHCIGGQCVNVCPPKLPVCPKDLRTCPDGKTQVGRDPNKQCAFKPCPTCQQKTLKCPTKRVCHGSGMFRFCYNIPNCRLECVKWAPAGDNTQESEVLFEQGMENTVARVCLRKTVICPSRRVCHGSGIFRFCYNVPACRMICAVWAPQKPQESEVVGTENVARVCLRKKLTCPTKRVCRGSGMFRFCYNIPVCRYICAQWLPSPAPAPKSSNQYIIGGALISGVGLFGGLVSYFYRKRQNGIDTSEYESLV